MASIEEKVEEYYKAKLDTLDVRHFAKNEPMNQSIDNALKSAASKSGNTGNNYPDIKLLLRNSSVRFVPVMIEAKGTKNKLEKLNKDGNIIGVTVYESDGRPGKDGEPTHRKGELNYSAVSGYAVNGALHYGKTVLEYSDYKEAIIIGINGTTLDKDGNVTDSECKAYYISEQKQPRTETHKGDYCRRLVNAQR